MSILEAALLAEPPNASRRRLLTACAGTILTGGAAAAAVVPAQATAPHPDAAVIELCHELRAIEDRVNAIFAEPTDEADPDGFEDRREAMVAALQQRQHALAGRIMASRAETPDAITAIALALAVHAGHGGYSLDLDPDTTGGRLLRALLRETLRLHCQPVPANLAADDDSNGSIILTEQIDIDFIKYVRTLTAAGRGLLSQAMDRILCGVPVDQAMAAFHAGLAALPNGGLASLPDGAA